MRIWMTMTATAVITGVYTTAAITIDDDADPLVVVTVVYCFAMFWLILLNIHWMGRHHQ